MLLSTIHLLKDVNDSQNDKKCPWIVYKNAKTSDCRFDLKVQTHMWTCLSHIPLNSLRHNMSPDDLRSAKPLLLGQPVFLTVTESVWHCVHCLCVVLKNGKVCIRTHCDQKGCDRQSVHTGCLGFTVHVTLSENRETYTHAHINALTCLKEKTL